MRRNNIVRPNRGTSSQKQMKNAVAAILDNRIYYTLATNRNDPEFRNATKMPLIPKPSIFSQETEAEMLAHVLDLQKRLFRITMNDLRSLARQLMEKSNRILTYKYHNAMNVWVLEFIKRHPEVSLRKPDSTPKAGGCDKEDLVNFYKLLGDIYDLNKITSDRIYNADDIRVSITTKSSKIHVKTGSKEAGSFYSTDKIATVTVKVCFNASGRYMPLMMIFPRKHTQPELMNNAPRGAWSVCDDMGNTTELYLQWFKRFIDFSGATKERQVLLLLDGQAPFTKNIQLLTIARENGVIIISFPHHTVHRLQPIDEVFVKPLSKHYDEVVTSWHQCYPGLGVPISQVAELFGKAFTKAATSSTAIDGFKKCGIFPLDPTVFTEIDFLLSAPIEFQFQEFQIQEKSKSAQAGNILKPHTSKNNNIFYSHLYRNPRPGCSFWPC